MNCCQPIDVDKTPKGKCLKITLYICAAIKLAFLVLQIVFKVNNDIFSTILCFVLLLLLAIIHESIMAIFLAFFTMFDLVFEFVFLGQRVQNHILNLDDQDKYLSDRKGAIVVESFLFAFDIALVIICYMAYKEFGAIEKGYIEDYRNMRNDDEENANEQNKGKFVPFSGQGHAVGGN